MACPSIAVGVVRTHRRAGQAQFHFDLRVGVHSSAVPGQSVSFSAVQMPVAIDYLAVLALRQMALIQDELPKYLLAPEVSALLHYVPDLQEYPYAH